MSRKVNQNVNVCLGNTPGRREIVQLADVGESIGIFPKFGSDCIELPWRARRDQEYAEFVAVMPRDTAQRSTS